MTLIEQMKLSPEEIKYLKFVIRNDLETVSGDPANLSDRIVAEGLLEKLDAA